MINIPGSTETSKPKSLGKCTPNLSKNISKIFFFLNVLKPKIYFTYHQLQQRVILCSAHTVHLCGVYGSQNKQRLFHYTALT